MSSLFIRADSIITIYDQRNVTPVRNAIRRETNQPDLPTLGQHRSGLELSFSRLEYGVHDRLHIYPLCGFFLLPLA